MKKELNIKTEQKCWSLVNNITYAEVPFWYGATYKNLKCSICMPKVRGGERYPLLVWLCGGAFKVMDVDVWWPQWTEFARRGCIVASVEYRTSNEEVFPAALCDVKTAIRYLKAHAERYGIDPEQVYVAGESAGGALASLVGVTSRSARGIYDVGQWLEMSSSVQGVIDYYGVTDMRMDMTIPIQSGTNATAGSRRQFLGVEGNMEKLQRAASAVCQVSPATPPFLIFHGDKDELVDIAQSELLYEELCKAGVPADYYVLKGEGHGADAFYQKEMMELVWQFIKGRKDRGGR